MDEKPPVERRERKKKGEGRKSKRDSDDTISPDDGNGDAYMMAASKTIRPSSSIRSLSPQIDAPRPSSSQRRSGEFERERVVRETVSFTKQPPSSESQTRPQAFPTTRKAPSADTDDYEDDFEDYADDFEDDDESPSAPPYRSSAAVPKLSISQGQREDADMKALRQSMQQENSLAMEHKDSDVNRGIGRESKASRLAAKISSDGKGSEQSRESAHPSTALSTATGAQAALTKKKKSGGLMGFNKGNTMTLGPRMKRLQRLRDSGVLDMQDEKSTVLNILPSTPYDVYHRGLFSQDPLFRQMGVPVEITTRDMDINTEEIVMIDKEVQYVYGDDTSLINAMKRVEARRKGHTVDEDDGMLAVSAHSSGAVTTMDEAVNENRLNSFLQAAAQLCEDLLNEEQAASKQDRSGHSHGLPPSMFSKEMSDWQSLGGDVSDGSNELVRNRPVTAIAFSTLQPHLLMTAHPYDEADEEDLRPFKGIYCIWSTSSPGAPSVVLEASGQPTCCTFSASQTFVVISGTAEGTLHLWDMRESNSLHVDRDTIDLRISKGLRKACYSTHTDTSSNSLDYAAVRSKAYGVSDLEAEQHSCPIVQVEAVSGPAGTGEGASGLSHFISLETSGKAIIWAATHANAAATAGDNIDYGLSPWGKIKLVRQRVLSGWNVSVPGTILPHTLASLAVIPGDTSSFLVAAGGEGLAGIVSRVVRYGAGSRVHSKTSLRYCRSSISNVVVESCGEENSKVDSADPFAPIASLPILQDYTPPVTCIAVSQNNSSAESSIPSLVLVGRCDGSLDLFSLDSPHPLQSWADLTCYVRKDGHSHSESARRRSMGPSETTAIVSVQWLPWKATASFIVADAAGRIYYFDLLKNSDQPLFVEIANVSALFPRMFRLSSCRSLGGSVFVAVGDVDMPVSSGRLAIRKLHEDLIWQAIPEGGESKCEGKTASTDTVQSASWVGRAVAQSVVTEYHVGGVRGTKK